MNTNEIQLYGNQSDQLTNRQIKMYEMLKDFRATVTGEKVKSIAPLFEKHGFSGAIGTIMKIMDLYKKDKFIEWNQEIEVTGKLAVQLEQYYQLYPKVIRSKDEFVDLVDSRESFPFPLKKIWPLLGYEQHYNAKRSLLKYCEEGRDFIVLLNEQKNPENGQNDAGEEIFYLSRIGLQMFLSTAQKPMAKLFARLMFELFEQRNNFLLSVNSGIAHLSEKANLLTGIEESIRHLQKFHKTLSDEVRSMSCDPQQLLFSFEKDATRGAVCKVYEEATAMAMQFYRMRTLMNDRPVNDAMKLPPWDNCGTMLNGENGPQNPVS